MRRRHHYGNLFVANLPPNLDEERLAELFDPYGIVLSAAVARDPATGARLRYGWVDIATEKAAAAAITGVHGTHIDGCRVEVRPSEKPGERPPAAGQRRPPPRAAVPRHPAPAGDIAPAAPARPRPQFQVERRSLPRRF